ncbi:BrnA antitoxin family protein [Rhizobium sp. C1]|uniref:BrnA antitoxin family protein n=1 Tax=Rhizobium sp. C1 TaxID=1349799 RepID=UPI001E2CFB28|nr:BrnA antitoxin family protein [Rhizobium sp. C1]MCD2178890.1 BrnA antitoxin family protein [Rhizobium sp. C1]
MKEKKLSMPILPDSLLPLTDDDGEVRELTAEDLRHFRPSTEVMPDVVKAFERMRGERGPQKAPVKERVGLRLDREVVDYFRHTGPGWQSRINEILAEHVKAGGK